MDEIDPDQQEVMACLEPYLSRMHPRFQAALDFYNTEYPAQVRAEHNDRAAANAVWCHLQAEFQREFIEEPGFHFLEVRGLSVLNIRDRALLRLKKVDANGRHSNADTEQQRAFDAQAELPGLPPAAVRLVMGYQPDVAFATVERVTVRRPLGIWVSQVTPFQEERGWIDITPIELPLGRGRRASGV